MKKIIVTFSLLVLLKALGAQGIDMWAISEQGGLNKNGVLFRFHPTDSGNLTMIHSFDSVSARIVDTFDYFNLIPRRYDPIYQKGNIYGIANSLDSMSFFIYKFNIDSMKYTRVATFPKTWGLIRSSTFMFATNDMMYANSVTGGANGKGFIYSFNPLTSQIEKIHDFDTTFNRGEQVAPFIQIGMKLYALSTTGGANGKGRLFSFDLSNNDIQHLYDLEFQPMPYSNLFANENGEIFGALKDGLFGFGQIFKYKTITNTYEIVNNFDDQTQSFTPIIDPVFTAADEQTIYGVTSGGQRCTYDASIRCRAIFKYDLIANSAKVLHYTNYNTGQINYGYAALSMSLASNLTLYGWGAYLQAFSLLDSTFKGLIDEIREPVFGYPFSYRSNPLDTNKRPQLLSSVKQVNDKNYILFEVNLFPSPFTETLTIKHHNQKLVGGTITDAIGRIVWQSAKVNSTDEIITSTWANGMYFYKFIDEDYSSVNGKIIKR